MTTTTDPTRELIEDALEGLGKNQRPSSYDLALLHAPASTFDRATALAWLSGECNELLSLLSDLGHFGLPASAGDYDTAAAYWLGNDVKTLLGAAVDAISTDTSVAILSADYSDEMDARSRCASFARLIALRRHEKSDGEELQNGTHAAIERLTTSLRVLLSGEDAL